MEVATSKRYGITKTELPPCCLRFHPNHSNKLYIGTYKLEKDGRKHGSLDYYQFQYIDDNQLEKHKVCLVQSVPTSSAILDIKFSPKDPTILVSAHSNGHLVVWQVDGESGELLVTMDITVDEDALVTSVFFNPANSLQVLVTMTSGYLAIVNLETTSITWLETPHTLECWTGSFGEIGGLQNVVYTGGDDSQLIAHDLRTSNSIWTLRRGHDAGVVSILSPSLNWNANKANMIWLGSYDDHLRVWDLRCIDHNEMPLIEGIVPKVVHKDNLNGGVWRLIASPLDNRMLTCCMYDGARVIDAENPEFEVVRYFKGDHESMCYGGDWSSCGQYVATCSFYDNVVQLWSPDECQ